MKIRKAVGELGSKSPTTRRPLPTDGGHQIAEEDSRSSPCLYKTKKRDAAATASVPTPEVSERVGADDVNEYSSRVSSSADTQRRKKRKVDSAVTANVCDEERSHDGENGSARVNREGNKKVLSRVCNVAEDSSDSGCTHRAADDPDCGGFSKKRHRRGSHDEELAVAAAGDVHDVASIDAMKGADYDLDLPSNVGCESGQSDGKREKKKKRRSRRHSTECLPIECGSVSADGDTDMRSLPSPDDGGKSRLDDGSSDDSDELTEEERLIDSILNAHLCYNGGGRKDSPYDRQTALALLARSGVKLSRGRWTKEETERLRRNYERYCRRHPDVDLQSLFRGTQLLPPRERQELQQQAEHTNLYRCLARGIRRPQYIIYFKARRMFHGAAPGPYDPSEKEQLSRLVQQHGRRWIVIGEILNRSRFSCHDTYQRMHDSKKPHMQGNFLPEEDEALCHAIQQCLDKYGLTEADEGIPWAEIAASFPDRTAMQLRSRWVRHLSYVYLHGQAPRPFQLKDRLRLLELVCSASVSEECHLDWRELAKSFDNVSGAQQLRHYWFKHLKSKVPNHWLLSFEEVCDYLYTRYEPLLRGEIEAESRRRCQRPDGGGPDDVPDSHPASTSQPGAI